MRDIEVTTPPPVEPVTDAEAFVQLKLIVDPATDISAHPQLAEVRGHIKTAREQAEKETRRSFVQQTLRLRQSPPTRRDRGSAWDYVMGGRGTWGEVELLRPPFVRIVAVSYYDDSNTLVTLADGLDEDGEVDPSEEVVYYTTGGDVPRLRFLESFSLPSLYLRDDAIVVDYVAGYPVVPAIEADAEADPPVEAVAADYRANVPQSIKRAILIGVSLLNDQLTPADREAYENARSSLLSGFKVYTL